jgi:raffinose/stachyose/melibiose transport system substrate-binding protein
VDADAQALIADFNKQQPNIKIDYKFFQYTDYVNALKLEMLSGSGPDIFFGQSGGFLKQYQEFTENLQPYATKTWGADWEKKFYPIGLSEIKETGKIAGLPWMLLGAGYVWYNNTIFQKYNLTPPKTYAEFVKVAQTLKSNGVTPFVQGAKDNWINFDTYMAIANQIAPGKIYEAEVGKVAWTDPDLVSAMDQWKKLFDDGIMQAGALGIQQYPDANDLFVKGQAAMIIQGTWANANMTKTTLATNKKTYGITQDFEFLPFLFPDVNNDGQPATLTAGPDSIMLMNSNSKEKDAVWVFMQYLLSDAVQLNSHAKKGVIPAIQGIPLNPSDMSTEAQKAVLQTELKDFNAAKGKREFAYPETQAALGTALQNVASGQTASKDALAEVEKASQKIKR